MMELGQNKPKSVSQSQTYSTMWNLPKRVLHYLLCARHCTGHPGVLYFIWDHNGLLKILLSPICRWGTWGWVEWKQCFPNINMHPAPRDLVRILTSDPGGLEWAWVSTSIHSQVTAPCRLLSSKQLTDWGQQSWSPHLLVSPFVFHVTTSVVLLRGAGEWKMGAGGEWGGLKPLSQISKTSSSHG